MHHYLSKPDWLDEVNALVPNVELDFDQHFVFLEHDWNEGAGPGAVAALITTGTHPRLVLRAAEPNTAEQ